MTRVGGTMFGRRTPQAGRTKLAGLRISDNKDELVRRLKRHFATKLDPLCNLSDGCKQVGLLDSTTASLRLREVYMRLMPGEMVAI